MIHKILLFSLPLSSVVCGQDFLRPVVVTATRSKSASSDTAYTSHYLDQGFLSENFRRNLPDALSYTPGVLTQKTTFGHGSPFIRGQTGRSNLLLVDGIRLNNSTWRTGPVQYWNTVDAFAIDHMELIKSQGSVPFGSDAIGGTLNAFTKSSNFRDVEAGQLFQKGSAYYEYRGNGEGSQIGRVEGAVGKGQSWGLHAGFTMKDFGDIRTDDVGLMENTGYEDQSWDLRYDYAIDPSTTLTVAWQQVNQDDIWRWHRTLFNPGWQHDGSVAAPGSWLANRYHQDRQLGYVRLGSEDPRENAAISRWTATLSYQDSIDHEFQDRRTSASQALSNSRFQQWQRAEVQTYGIDLELESPMGPGKWIYGVDYYQDQVDSSGVRDRGPGPIATPSVRPVADDSRYELLGAHTQYHWDTTEKLRIESGVRYTRAEAQIGKRWDSNASQDLSSERSWDNVVGSLRAIQQLPQQWSIFGGISQAFRAPNLADLSGATTSRSGVETGGSVNVNPEDFLTYEIGTRHSGESTSVQAAFFYTDIKDIIADIPVSQGSNTTQAANGRDGSIYGIELEAAWQIDDSWLLSGFAAWQRGETQTQAFAGGPTINDPFSRALPLTASAALRWTHPSGTFWCEARVLGAAKADRLSAADALDTQRIPVGGTPSYIVPMIYSGWQAHENLELTCGIENLTNIDYRNHGSGNNEPGFNAIFGIRATW